MDDVAAILDRELRAAGIPIAGVQIGSAEDRNTWELVFPDDATEEQRAAGLLFVQTFDPEAVAVTERETATATTRLIAGNKPLVAVALGLYTLMLQRPPTTEEQQALLGLMKSIYLELP